MHHDNINNNINKNNAPQSWQLVKQQQFICHGIEKKMGDSNIMHMLKTYLQHQELSNPFHLNITLQI